MSYVIRPHEVFRVIAATGREHTVLHDTLIGASELMVAAAEADHGAPAVVAELGRFRAEHDRLTALQQTRVERADEGTRAAIEAYHNGDRVMAEAFTRSSAVITDGPIRPPGVTDRSPLPRGPLPDVLEGP